MKHSNCYSNVKNAGNSIISLNTGTIFWENWFSFTNSPFFFILSKSPHTYLDPPDYLILPNVPTLPLLPRLLGPHRLFGSRSMHIMLMIVLCTHFTKRYGFMYVLAEYIVLLTKNLFSISAFCQNCNYV